MVLPQVRARWMGTRAATYTPDRIQQILLTAAVSNSPLAEQQLYDMMEETWPRLVKATQEIKNAVLGLEWQVVEPEGARPGVADLLKRAQRGMRGVPGEEQSGWRDTLADLMDGWTRGVSVSEIFWEARSGINYPLAWLPRATRDIPATHYGWQTDGDLGLRIYPDANTSGDGVPLAQRKFLVAIRKARKGHSSRGALLRSLAWWWAAANFSREWLLNFAQLFGQPYRWATYDSASPGAREQLAAMMDAMGSAAWGVGPSGSDVKFVESKSSSGENPQEKVLRLADEACDLLLLGQTLTTSAGDSGSRALGEVHANVRSDIIDAAAAWLCEILNEQLAPAIVELNYGDQGEDASLPYWECGRKAQVDQKMRAETAQIWIESGIDIPAEFLHEFLSIPRPQPGEDVIGGSSAGVTPALRRAVAKLPLDAREYVLARVRDTAAED